MHIISSHNKRILQPRGSKTNFSKLPWKKLISVDFGKNIAEAPTNMD
jgi:hypothetical protein